MESVRPTCVRRWIVACAVAMSVLLYLDRFCVSLAEIYMKQDLGLTDTQIGWMFSAFFWAYALCQVPSGWLTDRFGARATLTMYVLGWSLFTAVMGLAQGVWLLLVSRFLCGVFQAGAYPSSASLLSRWVPLSTRGLASSFVALGGRAGGALASLATALLIVAFVPVGHSSLLTPEDLLQPTKLAQTWVHWMRRAEGQSGEGQQSGHAGTGTMDLRALPRSVRQQQAARWLFDQLSVQSQAYVLELADAAAASPALDDERMGQFVRDLNSILEQSPLSERGFVLAAELPGEGKSLLQKVLLHQPSAGTASLASALNSEERQRLHRLILEAIFPDHIRRIYVRGWRPIMFTYGLLGVPVAVAFWWVFRNRPDEHPWCNEREREIIGAGRVSGQPARPIGGVPVLALVTHPSMWCNSISQFCTNIGWIFLMTWLPRYLDEVHRVPVERRAVMTMIPILVGFLGMVWGGRLTDRLVSWIGLRWGRALPMGLSKFLAAVAYLLCLTNPSAEMCVLLFAVVAFASDLGIGAIWAYAQDVGGSHVGSVLGWANMWGNIGAAVGPPLLILVSGQERHWHLVFVVCAAAYCVAAISALLINAEKPLLPQNEDA